MRVLVDTNVFLDYLMQREPWTADSRKIFMLAAEQKGEFFMAAKTAVDIHYLLKKSLHDEAEVRRALEKLMKLFTPADTRGTDCLLALQSNLSDYEDAVLTETALRIRADCIVTRNIRDFAGSPVKTLTPQQLLEHMSAGQV